MGENPTSYYSLYQYLNNLLVLIYSANCGIACFTEAFFSHEKLCSCEHGRFTQHLYLIYVTLGAASSFMAPAFAWND